MQCPHCLVSFHNEAKKVYLDHDNHGPFGVTYQKCPSCRKPIVWLARGADGYVMGPNGEPEIEYFLTVESQELIYPSESTRPSAPKQVPDEFSEDYNEAGKVLSVSATASAALSRRCMQHILREKAGVAHGRLVDEIKQAIESKELPSTITQSLHHLRSLGNFSAHPTKNKNTGEVIPVDVGEAEWCLDVIDLLFDHYFVKPELFLENARAFNAKRKEAGLKEFPLTDNEDVVDNQDGN